jgi:hypothetical protein
VARAHTCPVATHLLLILRPLRPSSLAHLFRTANSGSDWTAKELRAYNITVVPQNKEEFFGTIDFPDPAEPSLEGFMNAETHQDAAGKKARQLMLYLDLGMDDQEAAVDNFTAALLRGPQLRRCK